MKKLLLIVLGIIVFALVAFGGVIGAFYDTEVKPTTAVAHAEELEEIDPCAEGHLIGVYNEEELRVDAFSFEAPSEAYQFNDAFRHFVDEGTLRWNGGNAPDCQNEAFAIFDCADCGKMIVIKLTGDHILGDEIIESEEGAYKVCTVCEEHVEVEVQEDEEIIPDEGDPIIDEEPTDVDEVIDEDNNQEVGEGEGENVIDEPTDENTNTEEPETTEPETTEPTETDTEEITEEPTDETPDEEVPTETEEPTEGEVAEGEGEGTEAEVVEEEVKILGDELLAFVGLKDAAYELGLDTVKKIAVGVVAVFSFLEAFIVMKLFKKSVKAPKGPRGPRPQRRHRRRGPEVPIEGYREQPRKNGLKF